MRFTLGRVVHFYWVAVMVAMISLFAYGAKFYWSSGLLNIDYVSNLYDGTSRVKAVKERNDVDELKKFVDGDRIKDAVKIFSRLENDIKDLRSIKATDKASFEENTKKIKVVLINMQSSPELTTILNNISTKVSAFENFVSENKWPTLSKMAINLRIKASPGRLMSGGLYNFEKTQNLSQSINNDIEALMNFTESSGLQDDIRRAIANRIKVISTESEALSSYVEEHKNFNRVYKDFSNDYQIWFKQVEPEIALKKIQFEKSSQTIIYSLILVFSGFMAFLALGIVIYNFSAKRGSQKTEKLILETIKESLLPSEAKKTIAFSPEFMNEFERYRDYVHKRMTFGSIFQEAMPFASILLDSNLNLVWGNSYFYEQWKLQNFAEDGDDSLTWDFLQRFTDLEDNSAILSALRMSNSGVYKIKVKNNSMAEAIPYEMHVSPVEYSSQKRIMVIFYPLNNAEMKLSNQKNEIMAPMMKLIDGHINENVSHDLKQEVIRESEKVGSTDLYLKFNQYVEMNEHIRDELNHEIETLEQELNEQKTIVGDMRKSIVSSFETQRASVDKYTQFKNSVTAVLDARDQLEEQFKFAMNSSRDLYKDQNRIFSHAEKAEKSVDDYVKSLKTITTLKQEFKELKTSVDDFKTRIVQILDQLLIFQTNDDEASRLDQFIGKFKFELKGFEKVLIDFGDVVTQLDVTVTKVDMMVEGRERIDLDPIRQRLEIVKNNLENAQFSVSRISQATHSKDEEMVQSLKAIVTNLKIEMKRIDEMCKLTGLTPDHLKIISANEGRA